MFWMVFVGVMKLFLIGVVVLYAGMVAVALRTGRAHDLTRFNWHDPARTSERLFLWVGVWTTRQILHLLDASLNILEEASADVGEWVLHHR
ncbi:MAG: hypothetical protein EPN47_20420 [Acidobacteria bacterium]|nr:MAG: hypothetical protein EPN47_20420 [Acidobacteriota bacterium]